MLGSALPETRKHSGEWLAEVTQGDRGEDGVTQTSQSRPACGRVPCSPVWSWQESSGPRGPSHPSRGLSKTERCPHLPDTPAEVPPPPAGWVPRAGRCEALGRGTQPWASGFCQPNSLPLPLQHLQINWTGLTNLLDAPGIK